MTPEYIEGYESFGRETQNPYPPTVKNKNWDWSDGYIDAQVDYLNCGKSLERLYYQGDGK